MRRSLLGPLSLLALLTLATPARGGEPSSYVMLMLGDPTIDGALPGTDLLLAVSQHETSLRSCFTGLPGQEGGRDEQVTIWLDLDTAGHLTSIDARSDEPGDRSILERCLEGAMRMVSYPAPGGEGAHVVLPVSVAVLEEPEPQDLGAIIAAARGITKGTAAPPLALGTLIGAPDDAVASWEALQGKVVVLEFWATWCGPCIAAVPHLQELATEFADDPVVFVSITDEGEKLVTPFLARHPMPGWVGLDADSKTHAAFGIHGIPRTVLVGPDGVVAWVGHPDTLKAEKIRGLLPPAR